MAGLARVRVLSSQRLDLVSISSERLDVRSELLAGFPYRHAHADVLAGLLADLLYEATPKKGLITDLDDTLWKGILGDVGPGGVSWDVAHHSQMQALYQQLLAALSGIGVLVGVASANEPDLVEEVFRREDILLPRDRLFPVVVRWGRKSQSVQQILNRWNISADSVVFVDDSPMELAEVKAEFPQIECLPFPTDKPEAAWKLLLQLRDLFGKAVLLEEDRLRAESLRTDAQLTEALSDGKPSDAFLEQAEAVVSLDFKKNPSDARALELMNKTNQFNLNGRHYTEAEWETHLSHADSFLLTVSYEDKYGRLGRIAVVTGTRNGPAVDVESWVMSCRAFARRIEYQCLQALFKRFSAPLIRFNYRKTERNGPLRQFFADLVKTGVTDSNLQLSIEEFKRSCPTLFHQVRELRIEGSADERG
jgi:FkbH-like protein